MVSTIFASFWVRELTRTDQGASLMGGRVSFVWSAKKCRDGTPLQARARRGFLPGSRRCDRSSTFRPSLSRTFTRRW